MGYKRLWYWFALGKKIAKKLGFKISIEDNIPRGSIFKIDID